MPDRPNVLFVMTDQHRADALGADPQCPADADGRRLVHTPTLDNFVERGALFSSAYSPAPTCIPARRCLWTGRHPANCVGTTYHNGEWSFERPLPRLLRDAGYQTMLAGKLHSIPPRNHIGFEQVRLHEAIRSPRPRGSGIYDDYSEWLDRRSDGEYDENSHGLGRNAWDPRPWHGAEHEHPTNWTTNRAIEFLEKRDPTRPFFLNVSYVRPHQPFDPPQTYWDMYVDGDLPTPALGDWAEERFRPLVDDHPDPSAAFADLPPRIVRRARAAYYGLITQIDHQVGRILTTLDHTGELENTLVVFASDHGEMLGDHLLWRKGYAFEGSARVPMLVRLPRTMADGAVSGAVIDAPVGLEDLAPTFLSAAGVDRPDGMDGRDLFDLLEDPDRDDWRRRYHGEHGPSYDAADACQYLVDEYKYVWNPLTGDELLFDLAADPLEETDLSGDPDHEDALVERREALVERLADRPEGFSDGERLRTVSPDVWPSRGSPPE